MPMNSDFTAETTEKTSQLASNPFNKIVDVEQAESARLEAEKAKLHQELQKNKEQHAHKFTETEARLKKIAMVELTEFKNGEPSSLLKEATQTAQNITKKYNESFAKRSPELAKSIVHSYLQTL